jgi:hypothetical protein
MLCNRHAIESLRGILVALTGRGGAVNTTTRIAAAAITISSAGIYAISFAGSAAKTPITTEIPPIISDELLHALPVDMFGNEVTSAVATYKLDPSGIMYEEHNPDTALPRLGIPRS